jgi:hypothetical protein
MSHQGICNTKYGYSPVPALVKARDSMEPPSRINEVREEMRGQGIDCDDAFG